MTSWELLSWGALLLPGCGRTWAGSLERQVGGPAPGSQGKGHSCEVLVLFQRHLLLKLRLDCLQAASLRLLFSSKFVYFPHLPPSRGARWGFELAPLAVRRCRSELSDTRK